MDESTGKISPELKADKYMGFTVLIKPFKSYLVIMKKKKEYKKIYYHLIWKYWNVNLKHIWSKEIMTKIRTTDKNTKLCKIICVVKIQNKSENSKTEI